MDEAKSYVDQGFSAMKMKVGFGEAYDVKNVAAVRKRLEIRLSLQSMRIAVMMLGQQLMLDKNRWQ